MSWIRKYFIVLTYDMIYQLKWPEGWGKVPAFLPKMLQEVLNVNTIGSELKLIWNWDHRLDIMETHKVTSQDIDDYLKSNCSMLSFQAKGTRKMAAKALEAMGAKGFICVDSYRDMMLAQAHYKNHKEFPSELTSGN